MALFNRNKATGKKKFQVMGGFYGDHDARTKEAARVLVVLSAFLIAIMIALPGMLFGWTSYSAKQNAKTTAIGSELQFTRSGATVKIADVWTDKSHNTNFIRLSLDEQTRQTLSTKGTNFNVYFAAAGEAPKVQKMDFAMLGTDGDYYLTFKGKFEDKAYQIYIFNKVILSTGNVEEVQTLEDDQSIVKSISEVQGSDIDDNGVAKKKEGNAQLDMINFRINPYSENTKVYDGLFTDSSGEFDYSKMISISSIDKQIAAIDADIKKREANIKYLEGTRKEFEDRLNEDEDDVQAETSIAEIDSNIQTEKENIAKQQEERIKFESASFDRSWFKNIQTKFYTMKQKQ